MDPFEAEAMSIIATERNKASSLAVTPGSNVDSSELSSIQSETNRFDAILASYQKQKTDLSKRLLRDVQNEAKNLDSKITNAQQTPVAP